MTPEQKSELVDSLLDTLWELPCFQEMLLHDPLLLAAAKRREDAIDTATAAATATQREELREAFCCEINAYLTIGIMYGLQLADTIREVSARPSDLTANILSVYRENNPGVM